MSESEPFDILLVEDNPDDADWTVDALSRVTTKVHVVEDGVEALAFLRREGTYAHQSRPYLVLLDLRLPKKSGLDVLTEIRGDPDSELNRIPVIIMTGGDTQQADYQRLTRLEIKEFLPKPVDEKAFIEVVKKILAKYRHQMTDDAERRIRGILSAFDF